MKKILLSTACLLAFTLPARAAPAALGDYLEFHPYVGADFQHTQYSYNDHYTAFGPAIDAGEGLDESLEGGNIHVGNRFNKFFGAELGYFYNAPGNKSIAAGTTLGPGAVAAANFSTKVKTQGGTFDLLGYLPLGDAEKFDLIGTGGVSWTKAKVTLAIPGLGSGSEDDSEWGWRAGGGAQVHLTPQLNLRGLVRYQSADFKDIADHAVVYTAGLNFEF